MCQQLSWYKQKCWHQLYTYYGEAFFNISSILYAFLYVYEKKDFLQTNTKEWKYLLKKIADTQNHTKTLRKDLFIVQMPNYIPLKYIDSLYIVQGPQVLK